jgi:two-component system phosphate regulon sensor histidine kinase PhoR
MPSSVHSNTPLNESFTRLTVIALAALLLAIVSTAYAWSVSANCPGGTGWGAMCLSELILAGACAWALLLIRRAKRSLDAARDAARTLIKDNAGLSSVATVEQWVGRVGEVWATGDAQLRNERDGFKSILAAMSEGILVVDSSRCVLFSNPAARKILGIADDSLLAQSLLQLTQQAELLANIDMSIVAMQACSFEFNLSDEPGEPKRYIQAHCAPYKNERQALSGAVAVLHDITELRRLERMRSEFVSNVSHELRTPLTSLIGYLETLELSSFEDVNEARDFLGICVRQAENLNRIVEDLLRLSRLENPQSEIADAHVSLNEVVRSAVEQSSSTAVKRGITLNCETPDIDAHITGDRGLLVQAVGNLIENAIHYNREHGSVNVKLSTVKRINGNGNGHAHTEGIDDDFEWQIAVIDTGIGIPQDALQRVFERFYRVDKARSRSQGGTGLGLAIVKHIALAHGASVHVESEVGRGTTFLIRLKARRPRSERMTAKK